MPEKKRLNLEVSAELYADVERMAAESGTSMANVFRVAFAVYIVCHKAKKEGRHVGLVDDPKRLDTELLGLL